MVTLTKKTGDTVTAKVNVTNASDGWAGNYTIYISLKDKDGTVYYLLKNNTTGNYEYNTGTSQVGYSNPQENIAADGNAHTFTYSATVPDCADGIVKGKAEIYDDSGLTSLFATEWDDAYTYSKKKFNIQAVTLEWS